jgi:hypothetical protein
MCYLTTVYAVPCDDEELGEGRIMSILAYWGIVLAATAVLAQQPDSIGQVVALTGQAAVQHRAGMSTEPLTMQSRVYQDDLIHTQTNSKVRLALVDGTTLVLGQESTLHLSEFVYSPGQSRKSLLTIVQGVFRLAVSMLPRSTFEVHTTNTVAAVRGTEWLGQVTRDATAMAVLEGEVAVSHARPEVGGTVLLTAGTGTDVVGQQPPTPPKPWGEARLRALIAATTLP